MLTPFTLLLVGVTELINLIKTKTKMSKKDITKKYKGNWWSGRWLNRYLAKRTTKVKHKKQNKDDT